jgi:hypothetical protein
MPGDGSRPRHRQTDLAVKVLLQLVLESIKVSFCSLCEVSRQPILCVACFFWREMSNAGYLIVRPFITTPRGSVQSHGSPAGPKP